MSGCKVLILCSLASAMAGCLAFADSINTPPMVTLESPSEPLVLKKSALFIAHASDPNQSEDTLQFDWYQGRTCEEAAALPPAASLVGRNTFSPVLTELGPGCVGVIVTDDRGATASAYHPYKVDNQAPTAHIDVVSTAGQPASTPGQSLSLPLFATVVLSGAASNDAEDDAQHLTPKWTVYKDEKPVATIATCPDKTKGEFVCTFTTQDPGSYRVELVVVDSGELSSEPAEQAIDVGADQLPSIELDSAAPLAPTAPDDPPLLALASLDLTFAINRVDDDGDPYPSSDRQNPYPAPPAGFVWYLRHFQPVSDPFRRWIGNSPTLTIPAGTFLPGDTIQVRAEYHDRVTACQPRTPGCNAAFSACDVAATICYASDFRAQWVTWTVAFQ
jgi:hypothetical protein